MIFTSVIDDFKERNRIELLHFGKNVFFLLDKRILFLYTTLDYNYLENEEFNISNFVIAEVKLKKENKLNISPTRMIAMRHVENRPIIPNAKTEDEHQQNRRVEFKVLRAAFENMVCDSHTSCNRAMKKKGKK